MPNDSFSIVTLEASGTSDVAFSPDEHLLYVAMKNGDIDVFDVATRQKLTTWHIGHPIGAISVSPDGSFLLLTGTTAGQSALYQVSTGDGSFQTYTLPGQFFWDVEIVNGTRAIVTGSQSEVQLFDLATHSFSSLANGVYYQNGQIVLTEDSRYTLIAEPGISSGPLALYDDLLNAVVARGTTYQSSNTGFNWGTQAVSEAAGMVIQFIYYGTINVYDLNLVYQKTVNFGEPVDGLAFDDSGEFAYVYLANTGFLAKYETVGWTQIEKFSVGTAQSTNDMGYGNQILVAADGKYLTVLNDDSATLKFIDLTARDETFVGNPGANVLVGGKGDDIYIIDNAGDTIVENPYEGKDRAEASVDFTLPAEVENLTLTGAAVQGTGNGLGNRIIGTSGDNILDGAGGNDALFGGAGADVMTGGLGNDLFYVDNAGDVVNEAAGQGSDRISASVSYVLAAGAEIEVIEAEAPGSTSALDLTGSDSANTIYANDGVNVLRGQSGNDVLWGFGGDDVLVGGAGIDAMWGGLGNDVYYVDDSGDVVNEAAGAGNDRIATGVSYVLPTGSEVERMEAINLTATTALDLTGGSSDNALYGNDGINILRGEGGNDTLAGFGGDDFLVGGGGVDSMSGGQGNDTYYVDHAGDVAFEAAGEGNDRLATSVSYALSNNSEIERLEAVTIAVTTALDLTGSEGANSISGNNGVNILRGEGGNDTLSGFAGDDFLIGGAGTDIMIGGTGNDIYYVDDAGDVVVEAAGEGSDRIAASASYALASNSEIERLEAVTIAATNAFDLTGSGSANIVSGNEGVNILRGEGGNDFLTGYGGDDFLVGGAGADIMTGGLGNDTYYVDAVGDAINEAAGEGSDRVVAAASYTLGAGAEVETLEAVTRSATNAMDLAGSASANAIFGNDGANTLDGRGGNDVLWGHGGADTFAFTTALGAGNVDRIADFVSGTDRIALDDARFGGLALGALNANAFVTGSQAGDADDRIVYNQATGELFFDADGNGAGAAILFATLDGQPSLAATDFTVI